RHPDASGPTATPHPRGPRRVREGTHPRTSAGGPGAGPGARDAARQTTEGAGHDRRSWRVCARRGAHVGRVPFDCGAVDYVWTAGASRRAIGRIEWPCETEEAWARVSMKFCRDRAEAFEIPDLWLIEAGAGSFSPSSAAFAADRGELYRELPLSIVATQEVEPPRRDVGVRWFDRDRMVAILRGMV